MTLDHKTSQVAIANNTVSPLSCVSCVPTSCVHIWFVSCPCFMSLWVKYVPAVFMWLCVNYPVYISPVFWVWFRLVYSLLPVFPVCQPCLALPCLALMSSLNTIIWVYILVCVFLFLPRVCTVTNTLYGSKWSIFLLCQKIIRILSKDVPFRYFVNFLP